MVIPILLQRLTLQMASHRSYCLVNLFKASRQRQLCPSLVLHQHDSKLRVNHGFNIRCKSDLPTNQDGDGDGDSSNYLDDSAKLSGDNLTSTPEVIESIDEGLAPSLTSKYKLFEKGEEEIILDYREELIAEEMATDWPSDGINFSYRSGPSKFDEVNLERGKLEVIDIEELVTILRRENMEDIFVLSLPKEVRYTDYMLIASAKSTKHLSAVTDYLVKVWKLKKHRKDPFLTVEGEKSSDWKTLDMRSIMVHLFLPQTRSKYDLESLWSLGSQFDDLTQKPTIDPSIDILEKHLDYLKKLKPVEPEIRRSDMIPVHVRPGSMTRAQMKEYQKELIRSKALKNPTNTLN